MISVPDSTVFWGPPFNSACVHASSSRCCHLKGKITPKCSGFCMHLPLQILTPWSSAWCSHRAEDAWSVSRALLFIRIGRVGEEEEEGCSTRLLFGFCISYRDRLHVV